jgi:uncharacterized NAD(P)/FAD-binding protein YdhS
MAGSTPTPWCWPPATCRPPRPARLIREVRASAAAHPGGWQDVVDTVRWQIPGLWARLPEADQRLFLTRVAHRGRVVAASDRPGGVQLRIDGGGQVSELTAGWLVNCTGPATDITATAHPLLRHLRDAGLVRPDRLRLGLDTDPRGAWRDADGQTTGYLFALGPLLRGAVRNDVDSRDPRPGRRAGPPPAGRAAATRPGSAA